MILDSTPKRKKEPLFPFESIDPFPSSKDEYVEYGVLVQVAWKVDSLRMTINDLKLESKHKLEVIEPSPKRWRKTLNEKAQILVWRRSISCAKDDCKATERSWAVRKVEDYKSNVGHSERQTRPSNQNFPCNGFLKWGHHQTQHDCCDGHVDSLIPQSSKTCIGLGWKMSVTGVFPATLVGTSIPAYYLPNGE